MMDNRDGMKKGLHQRIFISSQSPVFNHLAQLGDSKAIRARINYLLTLGLAFEQKGGNLDGSLVQVSNGLENETNVAITEIQPRKKSKAQIPSSGKPSDKSPPVSKNAYDLQLGSVASAWDIA